LSKKVRIHDLAKDFGMSGKDLAAKLRDLGFSQVKSHMSALDDFEVLQVQGVLAAHGFARQIDEDVEGPPGAAGIKVFKKKKKKPAEPARSRREPPLTPPIEDARPEPPAAAAVPPLEAAAPEPAAFEPEPEAPPAEVAPAAAATPETRPEPAAAALEPETAARATPEPARAEPLPEPEAAEVEAEPPPEPLAQPTLGARAPEAFEVPTGDGEAAAVEAGPADSKVKPRGTVVGFIDPSTFTGQEKKKAESRRLRSRDEDAPDVQPTFSHDRSRAMMRGAGGARGELTAAQLRERESGRFLRRRGAGGPQQAGGRGGSGRRGAGPVRGGPGRGGSGRREDVTESPLAGGSVSVEAPITIAKLAESLKLKSNVLLKMALHEKLGLFTMNSLLDEDTARLLASEFDVDLEIRHEISAEQAHLEEVKLKRSSVEEAKLVLRPPTVAFLGHVDHGKTTLIDTIRQTRVAEGEAGGITQHIGAYQVKTKLGHKVTIVDTPGHAAFTAMRARGAQAVDIVVLVVAGDDGVKAHTEEALNHARAAGTPIIVAINKKDKPGYDATRVMQQLAVLGLNPEEWGGETAMLQVSGLKGEGIEDLLERVFLEGEVLELKAHPEGPASGVVLEAEIQQGQGIVAHLLVQDGTLDRGDIILAGEGYGKVKSIHDDRGKTIPKAGPSMPVEVTGLSALPGVGDAFHVVESLGQAKEVAEERERNNRALALASERTSSADLQAILGGEGSVGRKTINLIVRADVQGSVEVIRSTMTEIQHEEVEVKILNAGVGAITESDIDLASTAGALVVAFHVGVNGKARTAAERAGVEIRRFDVIYELVDHIRDLMEGSLAPDLNEEVTGHVEVRRLFKSSKVGVIAGCMVLDGSVFRDSKIRLLRDDQVVHTGLIGSLRRESDDAREVREGFECGIVLRDYRDVREGDVIEAFRVVEVKRTLDPVR